MLAGLCIYAMLQKWDLAIMPTCFPALPGFCIGRIKGI